MPSPSSPLYWIALGDIHNAIGTLPRIPELADAAGIIVSGDLTNLGEAGDAAAIMDALRATGKRVWAQIGNMDKPGVNDWLNGQGCNLHCQVLELTAGVGMFGVGGSTITPFNTPSEFSEEQYSAWLDTAWKKAQSFPHTLLVSHNPPKDTACDVIPGGIHVGSQAVRDFIAQAQPEVCICGHIHEARATDSIGRTQIVNPGAFADGGYVVLTWDQNALEAQLCTL